MGVLRGETGKGERVRQERTAQRVTEAAWQTPPGARPNRDGTNLRVQGRNRPRRPGWLLEAPGNRRPRGMIVQGCKPQTEPGLQIL